MLPYLSSVSRPGALGILDRVDREVVSHVRERAEEVPAMLSRLLDTHELIIRTPTTRA
jgi:hypothetical protein